MKKSLTDNDDTNRYFGFYVNGESGSGTELVRIEEDGKVGVGTTNPLNIFHVSTSDDVITLFQSTDSISRIEFADNNTTGSTRPSIGASGNNTIFTQGTTERMRIDSSGKVGIGYNNPYDLLHVHNTTNTGTPDAQMNFTKGVTGAANGNGFRVGWNGTVANLYLFEDADMRFATNNSEKMRISSSGNLGIGETSPSARLHVNHGTDHVIFTGPTGNGGGVLILRSSNASTADNQEYGMLNYQNNAGTVLAQIVGKSEGSGNDKGHLEFNTKSGSGSISNRMRIRDNGTVQVTGALSKGSGSFEIPHPLESKKDTHLLRHSFIEGPQCDNIYRGTIELLNGTATVDLDAKFTMTNGTFVALNRNVQVFTTNESDWDNVKGSVVGNTLTITCQNSSSNATVSWLVVGERQDDNIKSSTLTDNDGKLILEPEAYEGGT